MVRGTANAIAHSWTLSGRYLSGQIDRATWRATLIRRVTPDLSLGVEVNPLVDEMGPLFNWRLAMETARRPSIMVGTSSDRIGTPSGRLYYVTASKTLTVGGRPLGPYVGLGWSTYEHALLVPMGLNIPIGDAWSGLVMYDGRHTHYQVTHGWSRYSLGFLLVEGEDPGVTFSVGF